MKYISAQPDSEYFIWQLEVLDSNMRELGIIDDSYALIGYTTDNPSKEAIAYRDKNPERVFLIRDGRDGLRRKYIPSIRPHIMKFFFLKRNDLVFGEPIFYHDADILFRDIVKINNMKTDTLYVSDTVSYIGAKYINSKSPELLKKMCKIVGIKPKLVKDNEAHSGGAQYIFPQNVLTPRFLDKVERDSVELYKLMTETSDEYYSLNDDGTKHPIQAWTADMWALLWNTWLAGFKSEIHEELSFAWPMYDVADWDLHKILHNSGVLPTHTDIFYKGDYINKNPFDADLSYVSKEKCSIKYVEQIIKCKKYL